MTRRTKHDAKVADLTLEQIAGLSASGESETLEFKETIGTRREATMTVCSLSNHGIRGIMR